MSHTRLEWIYTLQLPKCPIVQRSFKNLSFYDEYGKLFNPLSANPTKWSSTLKQFVGFLPTNYLSVFDHFVGLSHKELKW